MKTALLAAALIAFAAPAWAETPAAIVDRVAGTYDEANALTKAECRKALPELGHRIDETLAAGGNAGNFYGYPYLVCKKKLGIPLKD